MEYVFYNSFIDASFIVNEENYQVSDDGQRVFENSDYEFYQEFPVGYKPVTYIIPTKPRMYGLLCGG